MPLSIYRIKKREFPPLYQNFHGTNVLISLFFNFRSFSTRIISCVDDVKGNNKRVTEILFSFFSFCFCMHNCEFPFHRVGGTRNSSLRNNDNHYRARFRLFCCKYLETTLRSFSSAIFSDEDESLMKYKFRWKQNTPAQP